MQSEKVVSAENLERLVGIVERVTYHNSENGWSVLKVSSFKDPGRLIAVLIHQAKVFAGSTMEFYGSWSHHPKHGEQFKAVRALEKKPATAAALEKYLGSGLIKGVGPAIARKIVTHFQDRTLAVFEDSIAELMQVPGIADKKLAQIKTSWEEHRSIRDVMIFLQGYGISTLFATKIYKTYGDKAIATVSANPYRLSHDIYGIGFFSADKIALAMGFPEEGELRIEAGIKHVLASSRDQGHCYLTENQIIADTLELLRKDIGPERIIAIIENLLKTDQVKCRDRKSDTSAEEHCYYSKSLYFDELSVAKRVTALLSEPINVDKARVAAWMSRYCQSEKIQLSAEQRSAAEGIVEHPFSILTGGPGVGKTTTTKVIVALLKAMKKKILLAAPTGRAAQRMSEVIGSEAKTIHRLLEWAPEKNGFKKDETDPLAGDILIVDETSMLDISLASSLLKAVPAKMQVLFIGDPDQLPSVGAGNVLSDLLYSAKVPRFRLTTVFRQAEASSIIRFAHEINSGIVPKVISPLANPQAFKEGHDCLFLDADEATQDQIKFLNRARFVLKQTREQGDQTLLKSGEEWLGRLERGSGVGVEVDELYRPTEVDLEEIKAPIFQIPEKFKKVDLQKLSLSEKGTAELFHVIRNVHPWSSLHYGLTALDSLLRLYTKTLPEWLGKNVEIQVLTPQVRGSLGTLSVNESLQKIANPESPQKRQIHFGGRIFRVGDRVIQTRNNYDLAVFNGDIGRVSGIDLEEMTCEVIYSGNEERTVLYKNEDLSELQLAYAITIHKSQGSEFQVVIIPVLGQHFNMLFRNLIYTGLTRARKLAIFVGSRKALALAIKQIDNRKRQTMLTDLLDRTSH